jgi:hypothetical protein
VTAVISRRRFASACRYAEASSANDADPFSSNPAGNTRGNRGGASQLARVSALSRPGRTTWSGASQAKTVGQRCGRPARWCGGQGRSRLELSVLT